MPPTAFFSLTCSSLGLAVSRLPAAFACNLTLTLTEKNKTRKYVVLL